MSYQRFKRRRSDSDNFMHISFRRGRNGEKEAGSKKKKRGGEVSELSILLGLAAEKERKQVKRPSEQKGKGDGAQRGPAVPRWAAAWPVSTPGPLSRTRILCFLRVAHHLGHSVRGRFNVRESQNVSEDDAAALSPCTRVTKSTQGFNECNNWMSRLLPAVSLITRVPY